MKRKVMVVEDDAEFAELLRFNLHQDGFATLIVRDGFQALRLAAAEMPDVILLDLMLPDLDGLAVCEKLNSGLATRDIPVLIVSALNESWTMTRKSKAKFVRFLTKPIDLTVLRECVRTAASQRQTRLEQTNHP